MPRGNQATEQSLAFVIIKLYTEEAQPYIACDLTCFSCDFCVPQPYVCVFTGQVVLCGLLAHTFKSEARHSRWTHNGQ